MTDVLLFWGAKIRQDRRTNPWQRERARVACSCQPSPPECLFITSALQVAPPMFLLFQQACSWGKGISLFPGLGGRTPTFRDHRSLPIARMKRVRWRAGACDSHEMSVSENEGSYCQRFWNISTILEEWRSRSAHQWPVSINYIQVTCSCRLIIAVVLIASSLNEYSQVFTGWGWRRTSPFQVSQAWRVVGNVVPLHVPLLVFTFWKWRREQSQPWS